MAITYYGSVSCFPILGNDQLSNNLFAIENGIASRVNIRLRHMVLQNDAVAVLTSVKPIVYSSRIAAGAISGGVQLPKGSFDSSLTSDSNVKIWAPISSNNPLTATPSMRNWQSYTNRLHSAIQKVMAPNAYVIPLLSDTTPLIMLPGEGLLIRVASAAITSDAAVTDNWWVQTMWEEDDIGTFAISGTVTLGGVGVGGALVIVIEADDISMTNARLVEICTTNGIGQWSSTIRSGCVGAAFVQYESGGTYYTAPGNPYLEV